MRKLMLGCIGCLAVTAFAPASATAAQSLDACVLQGTANFSPGLTSNSSTFSYNLGGTLSDCQANPSGPPESGTLEVGQTLTKQVKNEITEETDTVTYQEPVPSGEGTCVSSSTTNAHALVTWADGTHTAELYETQGGLASVLKGDVALSITLHAIDAQPGDPNTYTIKTNRFTNLELVSGLLIFQPSEPTACNTATGVTTAAISGALNVGSPVGNPAVGGLIPAPPAIP